VEPRIREPLIVISPNMSNEPVISVFEFIVMSVPLSVIFELSI
jgi:hypothetical protein